MAMYRKILVPLDGSPVAEGALPNAVDLAKCNGAEVVLLSAVSPRYAPYVAELSGTGSGAELEAIAEEAEHVQAERFRAYLGHVVQKVESEGLKVSFEVFTGSPAETIVDYARDNAVDIIVMATHGQSGLARWLMGSVAEKVIHAATVPVLLVRVKAP